MASLAGLTQALPLRASDLLTMADLYAGCRNCSLCWFPNCRSDAGMLECSVDFSTEKLVAKIIHRTS